MLSSLLSVLAPLGLASSVWAFDPTSNENLAVYYGQNSYGATHTSDTANWQTNLAHYCQDDTVDAFPLAFLNVFFGTGDLPEINLANTCNNNDDAVFSGSELANCQFMAADIEACQAAGKIVTLSMGGATGAATFSSDSQAEDFADLIWNLFLGGTSNTRPFGNAVLDGLDLDIEGGGSTGFAAFVTRIRSHASGASKPYYITAAPQCPFPDANLGAVINAVGFDAIYVQFYNNFCGLQNFNNPNAWDFSTWDDWAKNTSPNPNVKIYIGAPASSTAAGSGYVDASTFASILQSTKAEFSSFGGAMLWDISQAYANNRYDQAVKSALAGGSSAPAPTTSSTTTTAKTTTAPSTTPSSTSTSATSTTSVATGGNCAGVPAWQSSVAYNGGSQVTFNGHLWTAKWWSEADTPGGSADDWTDDGPCSSSKVTAAVVQSSAASASFSSLSITAHHSASASGAATEVSASVPRVSSVASASSTSIHASASAPASAKVNGTAFTNGTSVEGSKSSNVTGTIVHASVSASPSTSAKINGTAVTDGSSVKASNVTVTSIHASSSANVNGTAITNGTSNATDAVSTN